MNLRVWPKYILNLDLLKNHLIFSNSFQFEMCIRNRNVDSCIFNFVELSYNKECKMNFVCVEMNNFLTCTLYTTTNHQSLSETSLILNHVSINGDGSWTWMCFLLVPGECLPVRYHSSNCCHSLWSPTSHMITHYPAPPPHQVVSHVSRSPGQVSATPDHCTTLVRGWRSTIIVITATEKVTSARWLQSRCYWHG